MQYNDVHANNMHIHLNCKTIKLGIHSMPVVSPQQAVQKRQKGVPTEKPDCKPGVYIRHIL